MLTNPRASPAILRRRRETVLPHRLDYPYGIWTIRTDGADRNKIHTRTMAMEIFGHEFWSQDGKTIWYDLQTPKSKVFWLAGHELATGKVIKYSVAREHWSVHFNLSRTRPLSERRNLLHSPAAAPAPIGSSTAVPLPVSM